MPVDYALDLPRRTVLSRATGAISDSQLLSHQRRLKADPSFEPSFNQLFDFRDVTDVSGVTGAGMRSLARGNAFGAGSRRAFLVQQEVVYGLLRIFDILTSDDPDELRVLFRDEGEANRWLEGLGPGRECA